MKNPLGRRCAAEFTATGMLVAAVVGSGIMSEKLAAGNIALALLTNTLATGTALVALIFAFGEISGAHMNPVVSFSCAMNCDLPWSELPAYAISQIVGGAFGTFAAHLMFSLPLISISQHERSGSAQVFSEAVATFGLLAVIHGCSRQKGNAAAFAVGGYITAAYWFTASTSFANPAVTLARSISNTFAGIRPIDAPLFILAQIVGAIAATILFRWLLI